jgi:hypothetical protein
VNIASYPYTPEQHEYLNAFLMNMAQTHDEPTTKKLFNDKPPVIEAIQTLNQFSTQYSLDSEIMNEFKNEIDHLLLVLNEPESGISI